MGRKRNNRNPGQIQSDRGNRWYLHYYQYLASLCYQLFEWKNLPATIDPRYLEMNIHNQGYVAFYKDPVIGYIATQGAVGGQIDHYNLPTSFKAVSPKYQKQFDLYNYSDMKKEGLGVVIWNNDLHFSSLPSIEMFAQDLAELKEVIYVNQNAQKTPFVFMGNDDTILTLKNIYNQIEGNAPALFLNETVDLDKQVKLFNLNPPYVVDKLNTQKNAVWNEIMTWLGINNANLEKRERMISSEAESNNEQITNSGNIMLKARKEACEKINELYGLNLEVNFRVDAIEEFLKNVPRGTNENVSRETIGNGGDSD